MIPVFVPTPIVAQAAAPFVGVGDLVSGATAWWGLRAYNAAAISGAAHAVRLRRTSDNSVQDFTIQPNGSISTAAITAFAAGSNLTVVILYDQTPNGFNLIQNTNASQFAFILNGLGTLPVIRASGVGSMQAPGTVTQAQPISGSFVGKRTGNFTAFQDVFDNAGLEFGFSNTANNAYMQTAANRRIVAAATDNAFHAVQCVFSGAGASALYVDAAAAVTGNGGTTGLTGLYGSDVNRGVLTADFVEGGFWSIAFNATQVGNLNTNQHAYWGF